MDQFPAPPYPSLRVAPPAPSAKRGVLRWALGAAAVLAALLTGLCTLWLIGYETGAVPFLAGLIAATLPVPVYVTLVLWLDRYEPEPPWMLAAAFFWGALVAVFFAIIINSLGVAVVAAVAGDATGESYGLVVSAPLVEETAKALVLFALFFWRRDEFDGVTDGVIYAAMVGLGFAMTENFQYYGKVIAAGGLFNGDFQEIYLVRGGLAAYSHPLFTSMTGIGLGISRQSRNFFVKIIMPIIGLGLAMFLHFLWNLTASLSQTLTGFLMTYLLLMVPIFAITLGIVFFALLREGRVVREFLMPDLQRGFFTQDDYNRLITIRGRLGSSFRAFRGGGFGVWRARMQYNQMASELAFHRHRIARGDVRMDPSVAEREAAMVQLLMELRQRLGQY